MLHLLLWFSEGVKRHTGGNLPTDAFDHDIQSFSFWSWYKMYAVAVPVQWDFAGLHGPAVRVEGLNVPVLYKTCFSLTLNLGFSHFGSISSTFIIFAGNLLTSRKTINTLNAPSKIKQKQRLLEAFNKPIQSFHLAWLKWMDGLPARLLACTPRLRFLRTAAVFHEARTANKSTAKISLILTYYFSLLGVLWSVNETRGS